MTLCPEVRFSDTSELYGCSETNKNKPCDVLQEATIDDCRNMDGDTSLLEPWIGVIRFAVLNKNSPKGSLSVQFRLTREQVSTRPGPEEWSRKPKLDAAAYEEILESAKRNRK